MDPKKLCQHESGWTVTYRCKTGVKWAVTIQGLIVIDTATEKVLPLDYPEAAVWDLINRGYAFDQTRRMIAAIGAMDDESAEQLILNCVDAWTRDGFLLRHERYGKSINHG